MVLRSISECPLLSHHHAQLLIRVLCAVSHVVSLCSVVCLLQAEVSLMERVWPGLEEDSLTYPTT